MTRVYVFDHSAGFDWNVERAIVERERDEYDSAGWLTQDDGIYAIDVPIKFLPGVNNDDVTDYLSTEDWLGLGGVALWRHNPQEV